MQALESDIYTKKSVPKDAQNLISKNIFMNVIYLGAGEWNF